MAQICKFLSYLLLSTTILIACRDAQSDKVLSASEMEDLLYDIHLARAIVAQNPEDKSLDIKYRQAVLKKHGVSEASLEQSLEYYTRHTEDFHEIYKRLSLRFDNNPGSSNTNLPFEIRPDNKDTIDIWGGNRQLLLQTAGLRHFSQRIKTDESFDPGDKFILCFNSLRLARDLENNAIAIITIGYEDGTYTCFSQRISGSPQQVIANTNTEKRLKLMNIDFMINSKPKPTPEILIVNNIALIRIHQAPCTQTTSDETSSSTDTLVSPPSDSISQMGRRFRDKLSSSRMVH